MSRILMVVAAVSLACAAQKPAAEQKPAQFSSEGQPKPKGVMRCRMERDTGSNFMERVCSYDDKNDEGDAAVDETIRRAQQRAAQHVTPGGN